MMWTGTKAKAVTVVSDGIVSHHKFYIDNEIMIIITLDNHGRASIL